MSTLMLSATAADTGSAFQIRSTTDLYANRSFQAVGVMSSSTGTASVVIEVSNDGVNYVTLGTITLALTSAPSSDAFFVYTIYEFYRARVTQITTNATVTVYMKA
tara:strand:- start:245 stop:559 length:315 start_codon:yes stop_codon:yes gene_type:complete